MVGKFKMVVGDVISIRGQVLEHMYIPTGIERELVRFGMGGDWTKVLSFSSSFYSVLSYERSILL